MRTLRLSLIGTVILVLLSGLGGAIAQDSDEEPAAPESILFVGNSFTFVNDGVESHVQALAASEDPPRALEVTSAAFSGASLRSHHQMEYVASGAPKQMSFWLWYVLQRHRDATRRTP